MNPLVVELLGARGVGKSTLAEFLLSELKTRNLVVERSVSRRIADKVARQLFTLVDRWRFLYSSVAWRPLSRRDARTLRKRYRRLALSALSYSGRSGIYLIDEGVFQLIMELQAKTAQKDAWRIVDRIARLITFPDIVIVVEAAEEVIEERRRLRANPGDILRPRVVTWERAALTNTKKLLTSLGENGCGPDVIVIKNGDYASLSRAAAKLADDIAARYQRRSESHRATPDMRNAVTTRSKQPVDG
jgi:nucleoside-triphosphatase THEP1